MDKMFEIGDLVFSYSGYVGIITEITKPHRYPYKVMLPHRYPYKVMFISPPRKDDDQFENTEWCSDKEIKPLNEMNLDSIR
jgi:hypothetical protein